MHLISKLIFVFFLCLSLTGCFGDRIKTLVDQEFPPVDIDQQRVAAVALGQKALLNLNEPSFAASFAMGDIVKAIESLDLTRFNVTALAVSPDQQMLLAELKVDGIFDSQVVTGLTPEQAELLDTAKPEIAGSLRFGLSLGTEIEGEDVVLTVLPAFTEIKFEKIELLGSLDLTNPAAFIVAAVNQFSDNISGELTRAEFTKIRFPTAPVKEVDFASTSNQTDGAGNSVDLRVEAKPLREPVHIGQSAVLIQQDSVIFLLEVSPYTLPEPGTVEFDGATEFEAFRSDFLSTVSQLLPADEQPQGTWGVISRRFLADILNRAVNESGLCFAAKATLAKQTFSEKIKIPDETSIDCTINRDCTPRRQCNFDGTDCRQTKDCRQNRDCRSARNCSFTKNHDTRNCRRCLVGNPFGGCSVRGNDPICEAAKAAQNAAYEAAHAGRVADCERLKVTDKATCEAEKAAAKATCEAEKLAKRNICEADKAGKKLDCERLKTQEKAQCEVEKTAKKALCETGKEALKRLSRTGNLANVNGSLQAAGNADMCIDKFRVSDDVSSLTFTLSVEGAMSAQASVKYVPLDIVGHMLCQFPFTENKTLSVRVPQQSLDVGANMLFENTDEGLKIRSETSVPDIGAKVSPSPQELILQSYNMTLACAPAAGLIHPINLSVGSIVPEMRGDVSIPLDKMTNEMIVEPFELLAGENGTKIGLSFFASEKSFGGKVASN